MPTAYDEIRPALNRGFAVDNLREVTRLSLDILQRGKPKHPAIFCVVAAVCRWIADAWDGVPLSTDVAARVEGQIRPHLETLINLADQDPATVCSALDGVAVAFQQAISRGLD